MINNLKGGYKIMGKCDVCGLEALTTIIHKDGSKTVHCSACGYEYTTH
jgi:uncharacterized Zn finger protein